MNTQSKELAIFINLDEEKPLFTNEILEYKQLHIISNSLPEVLHNDISYFCFNDTQISHALFNNWNIHLSFIGEDLFNYHFYSNIIYTELFWFPTNEQINSNLLSIQKIIDFLTELNKPICISYNPYIQKDIIPEEFRLFVKNINSSFKNPLLQKEQSLLEVEEFSHSNQLFIQQHNNISSSDIVLGLFGDLNVTSHLEYKTNNLRKILKQKDCIQCEYNSFCINRGLGYIMHSLNYNGCIGIKLLS